MQPAPSQAGNGHECESMLGQCTVGFHLLGCASQEWERGDSDSSVLHSCKTKTAKRDGCDHRTEAVELSLDPLLRRSILDPILQLIDLLLGPLLRFGL